MFWRAAQAIKQDGAKTRRRRQSGLRRWIEDEKAGDEVSGELGGEPVPAGDGAPTEHQTTPDPPPPPPHESQHSIQTPSGPSAAQASEIEHAQSTQAIPSLAADPFAPVRPIDPWAHRRGEPRVFAFLWTVYVLLAVGGSILWVARFAAVSGGGFSSPAARIMLVVVAIGATVLWPMVRLSQASPRAGALGHVLADTIIVLVPIQLVLWPLVALAGWPLGVVGAVAADLTAWVALSGGVLGIALCGRRATNPSDAELASRSIWMLALLVLVGWGPLAMLGLRSARAGWPAWLPISSPLTGISSLTGTAVSGPQIPVTSVEYRMILATGGVAAGAWLLASCSGGGWQPAESGLGFGRNLAPQPGVPAEIPWAARADRSGPWALCLLETWIQIAAAPRDGVLPMEMVTADEKAGLKARLDTILANRPKISSRIAEARELGDLKENAEYHSAREEQGMQEATIRQLTERLATVQVVDDSHKSAGMVFVGATVRICEVGSDEIETFRLVGESTGTLGEVVEATVNSPFGAALEKSRVGDIISVRGPRGLKKFEIKEIV